MMTMTVGGIDHEAVALGTDLILAALTLAEIDLVLGVLTEVAGEVVPEAEHLRETEHIVVPEVTLGLMTERKKMVPEADQRQDHQLNRTKKKKEKNLQQNKKLSNRKCFIHLTLYIDHIHLSL